MQFYGKNIGSITPAMIKAGVAVAGAVAGGGGSRRVGAGMPPGQGGSTNVNPSFQQSFTPQFSPTMQQQQDSPGATQGANPSQYVSARQDATSMTGDGIRPPAIRRDAPQPRLRRESYNPVIQNKDNGINDLIMVGMITAGAISIVTILSKKKREQDAGKK